MLAIVCKTFDGVKAMESYDKEGFINRISGLHGLGASIGRTIDGRFDVICLEHLRYVIGWPILGSLTYFFFSYFFTFHLLFPWYACSPYAGDFIANDPQRRLDILKPKLPGGEFPHGFLGYAVNMIHIDSSNLFYVTTNGDGLRETLFYHLFSHLQVYQTRDDMQQALPFISDGAVSLDGGIIRSHGVVSLGSR